MINREYLYYVASIIWMIPGLILTTKGLIAYTAIPSHQLWLLSIWQVFSAKGWILLLIMVGLGMFVKFLPFVTNHFIATFYTGLGPMLLLSSIRFMFYPIKNQDK